MEDYILFIRLTLYFRCAEVGISIEDTRLVLTSFLEDDNMKKMSEVQDYSDSDEEINIDDDENAMITEHPEHHINSVLLQDDGCTDCGSPEKTPAKTAQRPSFLITDILSNSRYNKDNGQSYTPSPTEQRVPSVGGESMYSSKESLGSPQEGRRSVWNVLYPTLTMIMSFRRWFHTRFGIL